MHDTISRPDLCAELQQRIGSPAGNDLLMEINQIICDAPAISTEARWIVPVPGDGVPYCSKCKHDVLQGESWRISYYFSRFCPYCGFRMTNSDWHTKEDVT